MKLIVDIPEEKYMAIKNNLDTFPRKYKEWGLQAIAEGTPLDDIKAEIEKYREDEEPHLIDYRYYRNETLDLVLDIIDGYISGKKQG